MAIGSPLGTLLGNPLVEATLGVNILNNLSQLYKQSQTPDPETEARFENEAIKMGQPVTELPRGGLLGKLIGGTVKADPITELAERQGLAQSQQQELGNFGTFAKARESLGAANFDPTVGPGGHFEALARSAGVPETGFPNPTPAEQKTKAEQQEKQVTDYYKQLNYERELQTQKDTEQYHGVMENFAARGLNLRDFEATPAYKETAGAAEGEGHALGAAAAIPKMNLEGFKGGTYIDPKSLKEIRPSSGAKTVGDAEAMGGVLVPNKDVDALRETRRQISDLDNLDKLVDKVFPPKGANSFQRASFAARNLKNRGSDPDVTQFYESYDTMDSYLRNIQGRFSSEALHSIGMELFPNAGDWHSRADTADVAHQKIQRLRDKLQSGFSDAVQGEASAASDDDVSSALSGWKASK